MNVDGVNHVALFVADVTRVASFYRDVLELRELTRHHTASGALRSIWLEVSAQTFLAVEASSEVVAGPGGFQVLALTISASERAGWLDRLAAAGVAVVKQTAWTMYFKDPEGNTVALSHYPHPQVR